MVFGFAGTLLMIYVNLRVRKSIHVEFWRKDRPRRIVFQIRRRGCGNRFLSRFVLTKMPRGNLG